MRTYKSDPQMHLIPGIRPLCPVSHILRPSLSASRTGEKRCAVSRSEFSENSLSSHRRVLILQSLAMRDETFQCY
jgi:hypothetical protein